MSPLAEEQFVEYRDGITFERLGVTLNHRPLSDFWPNRGPVWDGLAKATKTKDIFLVEAKAHIGEMVSGRSRASAPAILKIRQSLLEVQKKIAPNSDFVDWSGTFYQYANRLAHLYFLREENNIPAHMAFVYFINATDVKGPSEQAEYEGASKIIEHYLGIRNCKISRYIHKLYVNVNELREVYEKHLEHLSK